MKIRYTILTLLGVVMFVAAMVSGAAATVGLTLVAGAIAVVAGMCMAATMHSIDRESKR